MSIDDDDLEKAGTRSRRQLTNSKQYSVYPPEAEKKRPSSLKYYKQKSIALCLFVLSILLFVIFFYSNSTKPKKSTPFIFKDSSHYNDSSQLTDYTHLTNLLSQNKDSKLDNPITSRFNFKDDKHSFLNQLAKGSGHTFDELRRLTNSISIPILSPGMNGQNKRVPVTAIIHTNLVTQLYIQLQAVLTQSTLPEHIWIICNTEEKGDVEARIMTLDRRRVRVIAIDDDGDQQWLKTMAYVATDFVWLIDQNIAPGKRYLENLLKLSSTLQYRSALLGTEGASLNLNSKRLIECIPDTMHSSSTQMKSGFVDMINDSWLIYRSWVPYLLEALEKRSSDSADPLDAFTGLFISRTLYMTIGIPSIAIPTDPIERAYWGDVRLQKTQKSDTCKTLEDIVQSLHTNGQLIPDNIGYRGLSDDSSEPVLFYVDSESEFEGLVPLMCRFASAKDIDLHIVTSGSTRGVSDHQIKTILQSKCNKNDTFAMNFVIHDIGVLHEPTTYNFAKDIFHRLTRVLAAVQPRIAIHSVEKQNIELYNGIRASMDYLQVPEIHLLSKDVPHALWIPNLPIKTLSKWNSFSIKLMITTGKKPHALTRLLTSATNAHYFGDNVDLTIFMDYTSDSVTKALVNNYNWKKGAKYIRHRIADSPKSSIFVETWYPTSNDEYAIIITDEVELSPLFYMWAKYAILQYRYMDRDDRLFGVSLYAPRVLETDALGRGLFKAPSSTYLMQWPTYAGAVYFPEQWREFHDYITARLADENGFGMQEVNVPNLRSSDWVRSWRRYFEELVYLRSYVMVYPSTSFSALHVELKKKKLRDQFENAVALYRVPLTQNLETELPPLHQLPVLDIWGKIATFDDLEQRGLELHDEISACPPNMAKEGRYDPTDLLCPFARIVTVSLENEDDPIPDLPEMDINVYS